MSGIVTRKVVIWAVVLALASGVFVLLAPEAKADAPAITAAVVTHDFGKAAGEFRPSRNAGYYSAPPSAYNVLTGAYELRIAASAPLLAYVSEGGPPGEIKWIGVLVTLPGSVTSFEVNTGSGWSGALDATAATIAQEAGASNSTSFVWSINSEDAKAGKTIQIRPVGEDANITRLTVYFTEYKADKNDPLFGIWDKLDGATPPTRAKIIDAINGFDTDRLFAAASSDAGKASYERLDDLYARAALVEGLTALPTTDIEVFVRVADALWTHFSKMDRDDVIGAALQVADGKGDIELSISKPLSGAALTGDVNGLTYDASSAIQFEIGLTHTLGSVSSPILSLRSPIIVTIPIPAGIDPNNLLIIFTDDDGVQQPIVPRKNLDGTCTFVIKSPGKYAFVNPTLETIITVADGLKKEADVAPVIPVLYDVFKSGDTFTFKTIITNAQGPMIGSTVTIRLNEKYSTSVTIGQDGIGHGTLEAPGFIGATAAFNLRVNGVSQATNQLMTIQSTGKVVRV